MGKAWLVRLCAILLALLTGGVFVAILGYDPLAVYGRWSPARSARA